MSDLCLNEGILQSYYDGQLPPEMLEPVRSHLASCTTCAEAARQVQSEMELTTEALDTAMAFSVPTERLRNRIDEAIAGLNSHSPLNEGGALSRLRSWLWSFGSTLNLTPQRTFGFASVLVFFVLAAVVGGIVVRQRGSLTGDKIVAGNQEMVGELSFNPAVSSGPDLSDEISGKRDRTRRIAKRTNRPGAALSPSENTVDLAHRQLPGERNYLQAISLLTDAIEANGETSLKPTLLADYRRNLEVVNEAIKATQRTARTNPASSDAAEMLFAIYQSKLDLLSAVAEQSRPMIAQR